MAKSIKTKTVELANKAAVAVGNSMKVSVDELLIAALEDDQSAEIKEIQAEIEEIRAEHAVAETNAEAVEASDEEEWTEIMSADGSKFNTRPFRAYAKTVETGDDTPETAPAYATRSTQPARVTKMEDITVTGRVRQRPARPHKVDSVKQPSPPRAYPKWTGKPATNRFTRSHARYTCDLCGYAQSYVKENGLPKSCINCKKPTAVVANIIPTPEVEGKITAYVQLRVVCMSCWSKATIWVKKASGGGYKYERKCLNPGCDAPSGKILISKVDLKGAVDGSMWRTGHAKRPKRANREKHTCPECDYNTYYLTKPPEVCPSCGYKE